MSNPLMCDNCGDKVASVHVPDSQGIEGEEGTYCSEKCRKKKEE